MEQETSTVDYTPECVWEESIVLDQKSVSSRPDHRVIMVVDARRFVLSKVLHDYEAVRKVSEEGGRACHLMITHMDCMPGFEPFHLLVRNSVPPSHIHLLKKDCECDDDCVHPYSVETSKMLQAIYAAFRCSF